MALLYRIYKFVNSKSSANGRYFARATYTGEMNVDKLAEKISYATTATKADCKAVIEGLITAMTDALQNSMSVKLDGFGIFKLAIKSTGVENPEDYSAANNIKGIHVNFQPCWEGNSALGTRTTTFKTGVKVQETAHNVY